MSQENSGEAGHDEAQGVARDQAFQSRMDWAKIVYDFYKNFMTVALASIAAAAAFAGGVFKGTFDPNSPVVPQLLVALSIGAFVVTLLMSIQGMHLARRIVLHLHECATEAEFNLLRRATWGPRDVFDRDNVWGVVQWSYAVGISALIIFLAVAAVS